MFVKLARLPGALRGRTASLSHPSALVEARSKRAIECTYLDLDVIVIDRA